jgi:hypothetical protein
MTLSLSLARGHSGRPAQDENAQVGFEWRIARFLILLRLPDGAELATTLPAVAPSVRYPGLDLAATDGRGGAA